MHGIAFINHTKLPEGQDFVAVEQPGGGMVVLFKRDHVTPETLADAWAAVRRLEEPPPLPAQHDLRVVV